MSAKAAPPSKDVIYVDVDDEITSIIDKVDNSEHKVVALVLPKRAASLQSIVNMKLLKRSADTASKNIVLITSEHALLPLAGAAGLHVAKNLQTVPEVPEAPLGAVPSKAEAAPAEDIAEVPEGDEEDMPQKFDYDRPVGALAAKYESENPETIDLDDEAQDKPAKAGAAAATKAKNKVSVPNFARFRMMLGFGGLAIVALIVFIIMALFVLPKATVTLTTASEPVTANFNITASDKAVLDTDKSTLPAKLETSDQTGNQQVTATGQQNNGDKAAGDITFSIPCSSVSGSPPTIPAGSGVSSNGLSYVTQSDASLTTPHFSPCRFTGSTTIKAVAPGSKYNVGDSTFSVNDSRYSNVSGTGSATGGTDNIVTILSQSDVDGAKTKLTTGANGDQFAKDFQKKLSDQGEYVLTSTLKAGDANITASPAVGQPASTASVTIKVTYTVLTVKKDDLKQVIRAKLAGQVDKSKQKLNDNFMNDATITVQSQSAPGNAALLVNEDTTAVPIIDTNTVKKTAEGKKSEDIKSAINAWPGVKSVDVKLSPFWVSKAPKKAGKIKVVLQEDKSTQNSNSAP
jgi:hypothetical protein